MFNIRRKHNQVINTHFQLILGCPYIDSFHWTGCLYWNRTQLETLRNKHLSQLCHKSLIKNRQLAILFLYDFQHLPWLIVLSGSLFRLKIITARKYSGTPPGLDNLLRPKTFVDMGVSKFLTILTNYFINDL